MPPGSGPEKSLYDDAVTFFGNNIVQQNVGGKAVIGKLGSFVRATGRFGSRMPIFRRTINWINCCKTRSPNP